MNTVTNGWRGVERYVCGCGDVHVPNNKDGSDPSQGAVLKRRESDLRRFDQVVAMADKGKVFK